MTDQASADSGLHRALDILDENLSLLTGHRPQRQRLVPGRMHVHRVALTWPGTGKEAAVCLQVLVQPPPGESGIGWTPAESRAVAEAVDLKARGERAKEHGGEVASWARGANPPYHLVLLDSGPQRDSAVLARRCAALEAGFLDGAGWMRLYAGGHFGEGTFTRVIERVHADVLARLGRTESPEQESSHRYPGMC